jgi:hypothetical protein
VTPGRRVALVSAKATWGQDLDEPFLLDAGRHIGLDMTVVAWDDDDVDWSMFDSVVLRSTWDYVERLGEFTDWMHRVDTMTRVVNPIAAVMWSLDKHYLAEVERAGVAIVPTRFVEPGDDLRAGIGALRRFVIKPAIGAGSVGASSFDLTVPGHAEAAVRHGEGLLALGRSVLVQPVVESVAIRGEMPMVFFDRVFSHAASKRVAIPVGGAAVGSLWAAEDNCATTPTSREIAVAEAALAVVPNSLGPLLYARVDLVWDDHGEPLVLEIELAEPSLFIAQAPAAAARFARHL